LCFGLGYSARILAGRLGDSGWLVTGTSRNPGEPDCRCFDRDTPLPSSAFAGVSHILVSVPPDGSGDPVLDRHADDIAALPGLAWLGYLSTTGVYGDRAGGWVDERSELRPSGPRGRRRVTAEAGWQGLWRRRGVPVHVFRLAAIYGPGRSPFDALRAGTAKRIAKQRWLVGSRQPATKDCRRFAMTGLGWQSFALRAGWKPFSFIQQSLRLTQKAGLERGLVFGPIASHTLRQQAGVLRTLSHRILPRSGR
jgi:hypothetical protein